MYYYPDMWPLVDVKCPKRTTRDPFLVNIHTAESDVIVCFGGGGVLLAE